MPLFPAKKFRVVFGVLALVVCLPVLADDADRTLKKSKGSILELQKKEGYKKKDCVALTSACLVCPDASIVGPDLKALKQDAGECLKKGRSKVLGLKGNELYFSKLKGVNCQSVSSLCAVCPDQTFVSPDSDRELDTDLYECVHGPRAKQFGPKNRAKE